MTRHDAMTAQRRTLGEEVGAKLLAQIQRMGQRGVVMSVAELCRRVDPPVATSTFYRKTVTVDGVPVRLKDLYEDARARMFVDGETKADQADAYLLARLTVENANKDESIRRMRDQVAALQATIGEHLGAEVRADGFTSDRIPTAHQLQTQLEDARTDLAIREGEARDLRARVADLELLVREHTKTIDQLRRRLRRHGEDA